MKNLIITLLLTVFMLPLSAQRFGYVDTGYILENLPSYQQAQRNLENQTRQWNQEIQNRQANLNRREADFLNEKVLLTDEQIKKEEAEIKEEQKAIHSLQEQRYGQNGDLIRLRKALVKPIQDQVWNAVKQVADRRNYGFVFDKGSSLIMVYTDPKFDISRDVLLQLNPDAVKTEKSSSTSSGSRSGSQGRSGTTPARGKSGAGNSRSRSQQPGKTQSNSLKR